MCGNADKNLGENFLACFLARQPAQAVAMCFVCQNLALCRIQRSLNLATYCGFSKNVRKFRSFTNCFPSHSAFEGIGKSSKSCVNVFALSGFAASTKYRDFLWQFLRIFGLNISFLIVQKKKGTADRQCWGRDKPFWQNFQFQIFADFFQLS